MLLTVLPTYGKKISVSKIPGSLNLKFTFQFDHSIISISIFKRSGWIFPINPPIDHSMCFSASPGGSEPTLNCRSTMPLAKKVAKSTETTWGKWKKYQFLNIYFLQYTICLKIKKSILQKFYEEL